MKDILAQYDRFIEQLRIEIGQMFWLYNFFFVIESALISTIFLHKIQGVNLVVVSIAGFVLTLYWAYVMARKNEWRNWWLKRIKEIEKIEIENSVLIDEDLRMWSHPYEPRGGLWEFLFLLPKCFAIIWGVILLFALCVYFHRFLSYPFHRDTDFFRSPNKYLYTEDVRWR